MLCHTCGSTDLIELTIEKHETWYHCYTCKACFSDFCPDIPVDVFAKELRDQGFPKDADRLLNGERLSQHGE